MDLEMQEAVKQVVDALDERMAPRCDDTEDRLTIDVEAADTRPTTCEEADAGLVSALSATETRLPDSATAQMQELRDLVKVTVGGDGATLESIARRLDRLEHKIDTGFADNCKMLRQHALQINALVRQQAPRRSSHR